MDREIADETSTSVRSYGVVDIEYNIPNFIGWVYMNI
jgi:hypothetical protein